MEEIKFRAQFVEDNKWHYFTLSGIANLGIALINYKHWTRYTGLKDKNGTEVYEGDIWGGYPNEKAVSVIKFGRYDNGRSYEEAISGNGWYQEGPLGLWGFTEGDVQGGEVVGNIYEHPELLK